VAVFEPYGASHFAALAVIAGVIVAVVTIARREHGAFAAWFALLVAAHEIANVALHTMVFHYPWAESIPINFCRANMWLAAFMLWRRSYVAFEVSYFWSVVGAPIALLAPDLTEPFPHPLYFTFFAGHALGLLAALYAINAFHFAPRPVSILKSFAAAIALAALAVPVNGWLGTNYLYLAAPPAASHLLSIFEPWPGYLVGVAALGLAAACVAYAPFARWDVYFQRR